MHRRENRRLRRGCLSERGAAIDIGVHRLQRPARAACVLARENGQAPYRHHTGIQHRREFLIQLCQRPIGHGYFSFIGWNSITTVTILT